MFAHNPTLQLDPFQGQAICQNCHLYSPGSFADWGSTIFVWLAKRLGSVPKEVLKRSNVDDVVSL